MGFLGLYTPESHGGLGLSRLDSAIVFEELAAAAPPPPPISPSTIW
jgi:alkylation response protein AidB-like acyl-CoA dehydrogenase